MSKHTPGPWEVDVRTNVVCYVNGGGQRLAIINAIAGKDPMESKPIEEANARLIAAAPNMLAALEAAAAALSARFNGDREGVRLEVCAAIAAARGEVDNG